MDLLALLLDLLDLLLVDQLECSWTSWTCSWTLIFDPWTSWTCSWTSCWSSWTCSWTLIF